MLLQSNFALFHLRMALGFCLSSRFHPSIFSYRSKEYCSLIKRVARRLIDSSCSVISSYSSPCFSLFPSFSCCFCLSIYPSECAVVRADVTWNKTVFEETPCRMREEICRLDLLVVKFFISLRGNRQMQMVMNRYSREAVNLAESSIIPFISTRGIQSV